jgi:glycine cleavage system H protein
MEEYEIRPLLHYTKEHVWVKILPNGNVMIGITDYIRKKLGEIVFVELPEEGIKVTRSTPLGVVESIKATVTIHSPLSGVMKERNLRVIDNPSLIAKNPYENWLILLEPTNLEQELRTLLTSEAYKNFLASVHV